MMGSGKPFEHWQDWFVDYSVFLNHKNKKMKSLYTFLFVALFSMATVEVNAQAAQAPAATGLDVYFTGKWAFNVKGTPNGDVSLPVRFEVKDGSLKGYYMDPDSKSEKKMDTAYIKEDKITMGFTIMSYDITITMSKKDDNNATGTLMDMFEVLGVRVKEEEKKTQQ
jgi:hypothetical protein